MVLAAEWRSESFLAVSVGRRALWLLSGGRKASQQPLRSQKLQTKISAKLLHQELLGRCTSTTQQPRLKLEIGDTQRLIVPKPSQISRYAAMFENTQQSLLGAVISGRAV